ncbi:2OG-Fe(II) oxygenase [Brevundimonas sp. NIBR11]|uniref:2OG-Fe(II) oxygenase n=1 Tax=Brevundimonas sp. NIBR11 TaxID=3015999 RepID=UPI0022F01B55|nr:2OG-Fe(II) oxygenase [Brevundimonas sp. NIBR11]WGM30421.1 PKHD-type hydroxylase YbiX [Brevundimonas sp. NIBR11]
MALLPGDPVPKFTLPGVSTPRFTFDSAAGRYLLVAFVRSESTAAAAAVVRARGGAFDDVQGSAFIVVIGDDPEREARRDRIPGLRHLFDADGAVAALYGSGAEDRWFLIDPALHLMAIARADQAGWIADQVAGLPPPRSHGGFEAHAPVLMTPRIFEPEFCQMLIEAYRQKGGEPSGVMRQVGDQTRLVMSPDFKRRSDVILEDAGLKQAVVARLARRLAPQIEKAFAFAPTRIERYLVARYDAETGGFFRPHRDNTTAATKHRRFAVSINLNDDYEGGDLRFPEFGPRTYRPPPGGACVFSCSVLHEATAVTRGERFAFLPFMHDEAAEVVRRQNEGALAS